MSNELCVFKCAVKYSLHTTPGLKFQIQIKVFSGYPIHGYSTLVCIFSREMNPFRKHWAHCFISWPTRQDGALSLCGHTSWYRKYHFMRVHVLAGKVKNVPSLLHLLCGISRRCMRRTDEQFALFSAGLRRRFKLGTHKKLAAVFWVWSAETSWSDLTHSMGRRYMQTLAHIDETLFMVEQCWLAGIFFCLLIIVFILLALLKRPSPSAH